MEKRATGSMGTRCSRHTLIVLFSFRFLPSHIHLNTAVTDLICIADIAMKTDLNLLNSFKKEFVLLLSVDPHGPWGVVVIVQCVTKELFCLMLSGILFFLCFFCVRRINAAPLLFGSLQTQTLTTFSKMEMGCFFCCESEGNRSKRWEMASLWVEETCLIKMKRWSGDGGTVFDACSGCSVYVTPLLHTIFV